MQRLMKNLSEMINTSYHNITIVMVRRIYHFILMNGRILPRFGKIYNVVNEMCMFELKIEYFIAFLLPT